jgi:hypothetical protein
MQYPVTMVITTVQMTEDAEIAAHVRISSGGEEKAVTTHDVRLRPLDTPEDHENYAQMATAAVCDAL